MTKRDEIHNQKNQARIGLRVVDVNKDPALPVSERVDMDRTLELHKHVAEKGSRLVSSIAAQVGKIVPATKDEVTAITTARARGWPVCASCRYFDYDAGQTGLFADRGIEYLLDAMGAEAVTQLGDWKKYGYCSARDSLQIGLYPALKCEHYEEVKKSLFGSIAGGVWKRIREI